MSLSRKRSTLERVLSSFDDFPRARPIKRTRSDETQQTKNTKMKTIQTPELDDIGIVRTLGNAGSLNSALETSEYIREHLFDDIPERRAGLNSTRMAELLNFRLNLPPLVTTAHVHVLGTSPSSAEREIASRIRLGKLRRIHIPLRGQGTASVSDLLVAVDDIQRLLERSRIKEPTRKAYMDWLQANPFAITLPSDSLDSVHISRLMRAGFLTTLANGTAVLGPSSVTAAAKGTALSLETVASAASGSAAAVGGSGGSLEHGGGGAGALQVRPSASGQAETLYQITVPNAGAYLKLLVAARTHLVELLRKSSRRELPLYLLKEYWEAGLLTKQTASNISKDPFANLLPGQTKKWKSFYGMKFEWIFEEAFGGGLIECFNTRSVGLGVRLIGR